MRKEWVEAKLGEVFKTTSGGTPSRRNADFYSGTIPWVKSGELNQNTILDTEEKISEDAIKSSSAKIFPKGTLLIALYGATIGKLAFLGIEAATNQAVCGIFLNEGVEPKFLYYFLFHNRRKLIEQGAGGAQPNISQTILKNLPIVVAPLPEQRAIVARIEELFSELDHSIANLKSAQSKLEIYRQSVLKKAFEGGFTEEWRESKLVQVTKETLINLIKEGRSEYYQNQISEWESDFLNWKKNGEQGNKPKKPRPLTIPDLPSPDHEDRKWELPKSWIWTQLGTLCFVTKLAGFEYTDYVKYDVKGDLPVLKAENVGLSGFKVTDFSRVKTESVKMLSRSQLLGGELLIVFVGAGTGNVAMVPLNKKYFLGPNIGMARPYLKLNSRYTELFFQSAKGKNLMMAAVKAVAQPSLSMATIRQAPIALPPVEEQNQIVEEIESRISVADKLAETIQTNLEKAESLRQSILKQAFEGKLLSEVELENCRKEANWEPAEKLLERIKREKKKK